MANCRDYSCGTCDLCTTSSAVSDAEKTNGPFTPEWGAALQDFGKALDADAQETGRNSQD